MRRAALLAILLLLAFAGAQAQVRFNGPGASINSPGPDGSLHGVPASILSPTPVQNPNGRVFVGHGIGHQHVPFGNPHFRHRRDLVPVPIFIPAYDIPPDYSVSQADPPVEPERVVDADAVRDAYVRGAQDALAKQQADSRYGEHYLDSREKAQAKPAAARHGKPDKSTAQYAGPAPEPEGRAPDT